MKWPFSKKQHQPLPQKSIAELKQLCHILFIDDENYKTPSTLKKLDGWQHVKRIKDITSLDNPDLIDAHIVFIDIQGVGKYICPTDEGLGLIVAIKNRYPDKKVIMYSAERQGAVDSFHKAADLVDGRLRKFADHYEYTSLIEKLAQEAFNLEYYAIRIQKHLLNTFGIQMTQQEIEQNVLHIISDKANSQDISSIIRKYFPISDIATIADLITIYTAINNL